MRRRIFGRREVLGWIAVMVTVIAALLPGKACAAGFADETLHYVITYKWGLVNKDAADATLSLKSKGSNYQLMLTAKTKPWADRFFPVRDTLLCSVSKTNFLPLSYSKISHEGGDYRRDDIVYSHAGGKVSAAVTREKISKKGEKSNSKNSFTASGTAYDMLSVFYWLRTLDYNALEQKKTFSTKTPSHKKS